MNNPFLNTYEKITYSKIKEVTDKVDAHVFSKVRLADILPINNSGISDADFKFALQSHVDFLVTNSEYVPQFSVEFDGPTHLCPIQIERDKKKNNLLKHFDHPFVRINSRYLDDKYRGLDLLTYFVDVWFLAEAFYEAQSAGQIPYDEPFDPTFIFSDGTHGGRSWPYWLSIDLQIKIKRYYESHKVAQMVPSFWVGEDSSGNLRCISWLFITEDSCVYIETGMKEHHFPAVFHTDLLSQIAIFEIYEKLTLFFEGKLTATPKLKLEEQIKHYESSFKMCSVGSSSIRKNEG